MRRNILNTVAKYLIGFSLALIAVSNCFNVLSNSSLFVEAPPADVSRAEAGRVESPGLTGPVSNEFRGGASLFSSSLKPAIAPTNNYLAGLRPAGMATPFAAMLTATKTDNTSSPVNPGDTIMYTIEITNTGDADATNVNLTDTLDPNTTLVPGSVAVAPIAVNDSYNTIGNVNIQVPVAQGVIANDLNPNGSGTLSVTQVNATTVPPAGSATALTTNGSVTMFSDGHFDYTPNAGFSGPNDTFTYVLSNSATPGKTDTAMVTIAVAGRIWFVNSAAAVNGDGRLATPFNILTGAGSADTVDAANDVIFLYTSAANYTGGITLNTGEKIIGQGASQSILVITGFTAPSGTNLLPATGNATDPVIVTAGTVAITLNTGNGLHGFTVGNTGAAGTDIAGTSFGSLTVRDVSVNGTGRALNLATGTFVTGSTFDLIESNGGSDNEGARLNTVGGSFTSTTTNIVNPTGTGLDVQNAPAGTSFSFGATTVNKGTTSGTGVNLNSNLGTFAFSSLAVTTSAGTGVAATSSGTVNVTTGSIAATGGPALLVNPTTLGMTFTTVTSTNSSAAGISLTSASGSLTITTTTVTNSADIGINVTSLAAGATANFGTTTVTTTGAGDAGINLASNSGTITFGATSAVSAAGGTAFNVSAGNAAISFAGNITQNNAQRVVNIDGITGGSVTFSGGTVTGGQNSTGVNINNANGNISFSTLTLGTSVARINNQAVTINNGNSAATYSLGTISIFANNVSGLVSTNFDGTLNVTTGSIDCGQGSAVNIDGPAGLTALGITLVLVTSSGGTANGVMIQDTSGSFTVNGDGTNTTKGGNGTGGTIANKTGADGSTTVGGGIFLNNATNISLRRMQLNDFQNSAIRGTSVTGFTLQFSTISGVSGNASGPLEAPISFGSPGTANGVLGSGTIDNCNISGGVEHNVESYNVSGTLNALTISNCDIKNNSVALGGDGILAETDGTASVTISVQSCLFDNNRSQAIQANVLGATVLDLTINGCTVTRTSQGNEGFILQNAADGDLITHVTNNNMSGLLGTMILVGNVANNANNGSNLVAVVKDNIITQGTPVANRSVIAFFSGTAGHAPPGNVLIDNNTLTSNTAAEILFVSTPDVNTSPNFTATVINNTVTNTDTTGNALRNIAIQSTQTTSNGCFDVRNNTTTYPNETPPGPPPGVNGLRVRQAGAGIARLEQGVSSGTAAAVLTANNPGSTTEVVGTVTVVANNTCQTAPTFAGKGGGKQSAEASSTTEEAETADGASSESAGDDPAAVFGEKPAESDLVPLSQAELSWMAQAAVERWRQARLSPDNLARLYEVSFEVADLPGSRFAERSSGVIRIDATAAGYGWFFDHTPTEDSEFDLPVPGRELQATDLSPANGRIDLLTVLTRELGRVYLEGKQLIPSKLRPLMEPTLSPGVRRMPVFNAPPRPTSVVTPPATRSTDTQVAAVTPSQQPSQPKPPVEGGEAKTESRAAPPNSGSLSLADLKPAVFHPGENLMPGAYGRSAKRMSYGSGARRVAAVTPGGFVDTVNLGPFVIPPGKKIVIMFSATVNAVGTLPPGTSQVCNQGTVSATGIPPFVTDDPDTPAPNDPTCTTLNVADVSITKAGSPSPACSTSNITYTLNYNNAGPADALNALVSDPMPAGTSLVSVTTPAGWTRSDSVPVGGNGTITFTKATSPTPDPATFTIVVSINGTVTDGTVLTNQATVTSDTPDPSLANNTSTPPTMITVKLPPTTATVGGPQTICALGTTTGLGGNTPVIGTGTWTVQSGGAGTFAPNATTPNATFTHTSGTGPIVLRWTISNPPCPDSFAEVTITVNAQPTATVGGPQTICALGTTASLGGNTPTGGAVGTWSIVTAGVTGTFNPDANTPGATFTHTSGGAGTTITLRWTVSNPPCTDATADVLITIKTQPVATVGGPQTICAGGTTAGLGGNTPAAGETGTWSIVTAGIVGTFNPNANAPNATFTHTSGTTSPFVLRWTVSNAPCTDATADVTITLLPAPIATVGGPQTICENGTTAGLGGNTPAMGETGTWSIVTVGATGTFAPNANAPNATFTPTSGPGLITVRWTVTNPTCGQSATADVLITVKQQPTATVGGPQTICALGTTASLGGNTPAGGATGTWSIVTVGATGTFNPNANTPGATFTHLTGTGVITLRWTVSNPPCADATADVLITINQNPTGATVGGPQTICALGTTTGLGGNTPTSGTGLWTVQSGGTGTFNPDASTPNATFTHLTGTGPIVLRWTISNAPCTASFAEVTITINQPPTTATVGGPQTICNGSATAGLGGNTPTSGTGTWSIVTAGATGTFAPNATTPNATFTPTSGPGTIVLRWTISNPPCPDSFAEVTITVLAAPTATVGGPQTICALGTTAGLGGNTPVSPATGTWSIVTAGATGTFTPNANDPNATFTHTGGTGVITLRWTVSNPPCADATADVLITITQPPTPAMVGPNQLIPPGGTTAGLGGNTPSVGTGMWSIVTAGATGTFNPNATTPNATFTHLTGSGMIVLRWTISNPPCPASSADVTIQIGVPPVISCPASPVVVPAAPGLCQATVNFTVTATGIPTPTVACVPPSGSTFPVGDTTVNCTATNGVPPDASCSFTVTVQDTQPPSITCPPNMTVTGTPGGSSVVVTYPPPTVSDNCPGVTASCSPPSGSSFPIGITTVTCTATDASGNTASCSFVVTTFDVCIQDDSSGGVLFWNSATGDWFWCCGGMTYSGRGTSTITGNVFRLTQLSGVNRVNAMADKSTKKANATLQNPPGVTKCTIIDRNISNDTCTCPAAP